MPSLFRPAATLLGLMTLLTGIVYPAAITALAQVAFPFQANGSLLRDGDRVAGSKLIGQPFQQPRYFWGRPSATGPYPYNGAASTGSNLGPTNPALREAVAGRVEALRRAEDASGALAARPANPGHPAAVPAHPAAVPAHPDSVRMNAVPVPVDLVTTSGSGLDPHITPAAAYYQVPRVARLRGLPPERLNDLVASRIEGRFLGLFGEPRVNVLDLNLALDRLSPSASRTGNHKFR